MEKQEKSVNVLCPKCKGTHIVSMLLERPTSMMGKDIIPVREARTSRQLGAILTCPKTHRKFHTSIVLKVEDCWDIKISNVSS